MYKAYVKIKVFQDDKSPSSIGARDSMLMLIGEIEDGMENLMVLVSEYFGDLKLCQFKDIYDALEKDGIWENSASQVSDRIAGTYSKIYINNNILIKKIEENKEIVF